MRPALSVDGRAPDYVHALVRQLLKVFATVDVMPTVTKTALPDPALPCRWVFVRDEVGGPVPAFNDGAAWRRATDRAVVS